LGTAARPVARPAAVPDPVALPDPAPLREPVPPPDPPAGDAGLLPGFGVAGAFSGGAGLAPDGGAGFGVPADGEPPPPELAATVAGAGRDVAGLPDAAAGCRSAGGVVPPAGVRPVVPDFGSPGDVAFVVTVLREPGPGVTVLWAAFTA
jgi:hypothetical protein